MKTVTPIFVKTMFGRRIIIAQSTGTDFSIPKEVANQVKTIAGFPKRKKLFTRYQGKDFQIMERTHGSHLVNDPNKGGRFNA